MLRLLYSTDLVFKTQKNMWKWDIPLKGTVEWKFLALFFHAMDIFYTEPRFRG